MDLHSIPQLLRGVDKQPDETGLREASPGRVQPVGYREAFDQELPPQLLVALAGGVRARRRASSGAAEFVRTEVMSFFLSGVGA